MDPSKPNSKLQAPASTERLQIECRAGPEPKPEMASHRLLSPSCPSHQVRPCPCLAQLGGSTSRQPSGAWLGSASWLPRLTWSWVAASSELSERRRWMCREWVRVRLLPQPTEQPSTHSFSFLSETRGVNPLGSTKSPALLTNPPAHHSGLHISL